MKVSIITVSYNSEKTIEQTIQSVVNQTYGGIEYIIVDGQSTDSTLKIVDKYCDEINQIISEPDTGIYNAMNKGIGTASGDIVGIINSDDWYDEKAVEKVVDFFEQNDVDVLYGDCIYVYEDGKRVRNMKYPLDAMWYLMVTPHPTVFIKKSVYEKYGLYNEKYRLAADYELMLRLYSAGVKFGYLEYDISYFRAGGSSSKQIILSLQETWDIGLYYINKFQKLEYLPVINDRYEKRICMEKSKQELEQVEEYQEKAHDAMIKYLKDRDGIVIFGTGIVGRRCLNRLKEWQVPVKFFVDNNEEKWGTLFESIPVCQPNVLKENRERIIVASTKYCEEISNQIEKMGYHKKADYITVFELDALVLSERK